MNLPTVFISPTSEDLKSLRQAAREAAISARFHPEMMEYFVAEGKNAPLDACRMKVAEADVVVSIVAHRYGWVPDVTDGKNITWVECEEALRMSGLQFRRAALSGTLGIWRARLLLITK